ncbi:MAG: hypothetical protein V4497_03495 [Bacteroidota bacterium]
MPQFSGSETETVKLNKKMIKEIFDIEPVQKNSLIIFLALLPLTFLQIYIFKPEIIDKGVFIISGICLALSVCWYVISLLPLIVFLKVSVVYDEDETKTIVFIAGILGLAWIILLTYISYELNLTFRNFIRGSIIMVLLRTLFWCVSYIISKRKK